jgi:hypothetical protein
MSLKRLKRRSAIVLALWVVAFCATLILAGVNFAQGSIGLGIFDTIVSLGSVSLVARDAYRWTTRWPPAIHVDGQTTGPVVRL